MFCYVLNGLYLIIWVVLLFHCLFRREFYPIFGPGLGTKVFWLLTFVFFNPILTLIYFVFGFLLRPGKADEHRKLMHLGSVAAVVCVGVVLAVFEWPYSSYKAKPVVILDQSGEQKPTDQNESFFKFEPCLGTIAAKNNVLLSMSDYSGARVSMRNIIIICQNPHPLLERVARKLQKSLFNLPYVDKVACYSLGSFPEQGRLLPDVFITIDMPEIFESDFFRGRKLRAIIKWKAGSSIFPGPSLYVQNNVSPEVKFKIEGELRHDSMVASIESSQAKYKFEAGNISGEMINSISKQFQNLLDKHGELPKLPELLYGTYHEPPEFSFLKGDTVERLTSGRGLLKDNHTTWRFMDDRQTDKALAAYSDELKSLGWTTENRSKNYLQIQKANEYIYIFRQSWRNLKTGPIVLDNPENPTQRAPMIAHYESYLTSDRVQKIMDALLDTNVNMETLLIFEKYFHTQQQRERLRLIIEQNPVQTLDRYLLLAHYWEDLGEIEKARQSLLRARAMQHAEKEHNIKQHEIKSLAGELDDDSLAEVPVDKEIFREMGFINIQEIIEPLKVERRLDEPVLFYRHLNNEELQTIMLRIIGWREPLPLESYRLLTVKRGKGSSSSSETSGRVRSDGVWVVESHLGDSTDQNKSIQVKIEYLGNERFLFLITP